MYYKNVQQQNLLIKFMFCFQNSRPSLDLDPGSNFLSLLGLGAAWYLLVFKAETCEKYENVPYTGCIIIFKMFWDCKWL